MFNTVKKYQFQIANVFIGQYGRLILQIVGLSYLAKRLDAQVFGYAAFGLIIFELGKIICDGGVYKKIVQDKSLGKAEGIAFQKANRLFSVLYLILVAVALSLADVKPGELVFYAAGPFLYLYHNLLRARLEKCRMFQTLRSVELTSTAFGVLLACLVASFENSIIPLLVQTTVTASLNSLLLQLAVHTTKNPFVVKLPSLSAFSSLKNVFKADLIHFSYKSLDKVILGFILGIELLGVYVLFYRFISLPYQLFVSIINRVMVPNIVNAPKSQRLMLMLNFGGITLIPILLLLVTVGFFQESVILLMYGSNYLIYSPLIKFTLVAAASQTIVSIFVMYLLGNSENKLYFYFMAFQSLFNLVALTVGSMFGLEQTFEYYAYSNVSVSAIAMIIITRRRFSDEYTPRAL